MFNFFALNPFIFNMFNPFMPVGNYWQNYGNLRYTNQNSIFTHANYNNYSNHSTYNEAKGELLANTILNGLPTNRDPQNPLCARYVKNGIVKSGLGRYELGNGEDSQYMLRRNLNFKEIKVKGSELENLKKGCAVVYDAFDSDGVNTIGKDGHVMVSLGDGRFVSDKIEDASEIVKSDNAHVFMVV